MAKKSNGQDARISGVRGNPFGKLRGPEQPGKGAVAAPHYSAMNTNGVRIPSIASMGGFKHLGHFAQDKFLQQGHNDGPALDDVKAFVKAEKERRRKAGTKDTESFELEATPSPEPEKFGKKINYKGA